MPAKSRRSTSKKKVSPKRTKVVWGALLAAMTGAAGMLFILDGGAVPRFDGLAMPALAATSGPSTLDRVFQTEAALNRENWQAIVIHHSGAPYGTAESIDKEHRALGLDGLGFHFVIGNGSGLGDGEVYSGYRWEEQLPGAHAVGEGSE